MSGIRIPFSAFVFAMAMVVAWGRPVHAEAPHSIVGVKLGAQIQDLQELVDLSAAVPIWGTDYLLRAPLRSTRGYQSGYVVYGNCAHKGRVTRIKLTYEDESEAFYSRVLSALTQRYGKPGEWRGNPFGTLRIWKWSLRDSQRKRISVILQHYMGDDDSFTHGNSIRLTNSSFIEEEQACFEQKRKEKKETECAALMPEKVDFDWFLPQ